MIPLAPHLATFLREHLPRERRASPHTCDAYAYSFQLLVTFAAKRLRIRPSRLDVEQIDVPIILAFLEHIERDRGNKARSRNARLAAVKSFFCFLEYRVPACLDQALRVRAIPMKKKIDEGLVASLTRIEIQALLDAPNPRTASGARDRAMLHLAFAAGLRVSELVGCVSTSSMPRLPPASTSWAKAGASGCCRCGKRRQWPSGRGSARRSTARTGYRLVPQWRWPRNDPIRVRVHPR